MAKAWRPFFYYVTDESRREYRNGWRKSEQIYKDFPTYQKLRREIKKFLEENITGSITVFRTRRGEWGEWFEEWELINGKPTIIRQGWN